MDFTAHNEEVKKVWESYNAGSPVRMPMILGINPRLWLLDKKLNTAGVTFEEYSNNADTMMNIQLLNSNYIRHNIYADHDMGVPECGWGVYVDLQNYFEAAWYGAEVIYPEGNVPTNAEFLTEDNKNMLFEKGLPDPFGGIYVKAFELYEQMFDKSDKITFEGQTITSVGLPQHYTDGPMTVACNLYGTTNFCCALYEDPDFANRLLDYITEATIMRIKAWNKRFNGFEISDSFGFADDSIALLGPNAYREFILPRHKRLIKELSTGKEPNSIHLCGDATRHFKTIRDELNVNSFDTGFPVKHGELQQELGPDVKISGGPRIALLLSGTKEEVIAETKRIIGEVKPLTKKFIIREGNNLAPGTPPENIAAMYQTVKEFGRYEN